MGCRAHRAWLPSTPSWSTTRAPMSMTTVLLRSPRHVAAELCSFPGPTRIGMRPPLRGHGQERTSHHLVDLALPAPVLARAANSPGLEPKSIRSRRSRKHDLLAELRDPSARPRSASPGRVSRPTRHMVSVTRVVSNRPKSDLSEDLPELRPNMGARGWDLDHAPSLRLRFWPRGRV